MTLDTQLLSILACPEDRGPLYYFSIEEFLYNPRLARKYLVREGIPIMLIEESVTVDEAEQLILKGRIESEGIRPTFGGKS